MDAILHLEDDRSFHGKHFGAEGTIIAEVVFNTGMTGYQEILTDPSYKGQMVTMTYPHIGNYGINEADVESKRPFLEALIVREFCPRPSNYRAKESIDSYLKRNQIMGLSDIDTRALTRHIREQGSMMGLLTTEKIEQKEVHRRLKEHPRIEGQDLVRHVTIQEKEDWKKRVGQEWYYDRIEPLGELSYHVVAFDFGIKQNILRLLTSFGMRVTVVPASTSANEVMDLEPDGVFLSNGPGDPEGVDYAIESVKALVGNIPLFGICLGHQIVGLAMGGESYKLKFGHHGCNHPVKHLESGVIEITSQNHNFALKPASLEAEGIEITHLNLNDGTVEGMQHLEKKVFSVQYHPEASPGPHDSLYLFRQFYQMMNGKQQSQLSLL
jgi:carbamoyl-phosphate synthase small subunit